jgi:hypothetical protein
VPSVIANNPLAIVTIRIEECWKNARKTPRSAAPSPPLSPDLFNSNGFSNCQADGLSVVCDPPIKILEIMPALCLAQNATCEAKFVFKFYAKHDPAKMTGYYDNLGKTLPAMSGRTDFKDTPLYSRFKGTILYVDTPAGFKCFKVGEGLAGPVSVRSAPRRFTSAVGYIDPSTTNVLVITQLRDLSGTQVLTEQQTIRIGLGQPLDANAHPDLEHWRCGTPRPSSSPETSSIHRNWSQTVPRSSGPSGSACLSRPRSKPCGFASARSPSAFRVAKTGPVVKLFGNRHWREHCHPCRGMTSPAPCSCAQILGSARWPC